MDDCSLAEMEALAKRLFDAIESADIATVQRLYAPNATVWNNVTCRSVPAAQISALLPVLAKRMPDRRYVDRKVIAYHGGFVHRHRITGTNRAGGCVAMNSCVIATVEDRLVKRLEEYCDGRQMAAVLA